MGHDLFSRFIGKFPEATAYLKRWSCFSGRNFSDGPAFVFWFLHSHLWYQFQAGNGGCFSVNGTDLYSMVNAVSGRNHCQSRIVLTIYSNREPTGLPHVNGRQPWFCTMRWMKSHTFDLRYWENSWFPALVHRSQSCKTILIHECK